VRRICGGRCQSLAPVHHARAGGGAGPSPLPRARCLPCVPPRFAGCPFPGRRGAYLRHRERVRARRPSRGSWCDSRPLSHGPDHAICVRRPVQIRTSRRVGARRLGLSPTRRPREAAMDDLRQLPRERCIFRRRADTPKLSVRRPPTLCVCIRLRVRHRLRQPIERCSARSRGFPISHRSRPRPSRLAAAVLRPRPSRRASCPIAAPLRLPAPLPVSPKRISAPLRRLLTMLSWRGGSVCARWRYRHGRGRAQAPSAADAWLSVWLA
jgi:hypothetical protein